MNLKTGYVWNNTVIKLSTEDLKNTWIPFYWGDEIIIGIATTFPKKKSLNLLPKPEMPHNKWIYKWELQSLDKKVVDKNEGALDFSKAPNHLSINKEKAIILKDVDVGSYKLLVSFDDNEGHRIENLSYPITVRNEVDYKSTYLYPIIISSVISLIVSLLVSFLVK